MKMVGQHFMSKYFMNIVAADFILCSLNCARLVEFNSLIKITVQIKWPEQRVLDFTQTLDTGSKCIRA